MKFIKPLLLLLLCTNFVKAQVSVLAKVDHLVPDGVDTQGNINLTVSGSTAPYTYTWNPGAINTKDINNVSAGSYSLNVLSASAQTYTNVYSLGYKVLWTNLDRCKFSNDSLICTGVGSTAVYSSASSRNTLEANTDGWFEFVLDNVTGCNYYIGFTDSLGPKNDISTDIDYGVRFNGSNNDLYYYEGGASAAINTNPKIGDAIRIERVGNTIYYKINGTTVRTITNSSIGSKVFKLKVILSYTGNRLVNVGCSFNKMDNVNFENYVKVIPTIKHNSANGVDDGGVSLKLKYGIVSSYTWNPSGTVSNSITSLSNGTYSVTTIDSLNNKSNYKFNVGYKVHWTNLDRCKLSNDSLICTGPASSGVYASATSRNTLEANTDGWFEYVMDYVGGYYYYIGFTDSLSLKNDSQTEIDYGVWFSGGTKYLNYYENGANGNLNFVPNVGDVVRIERIGNTINYKINGVTVRTVTNSSIGSKIFKLKVSFSYPNNRLVNVGCSFYKLDGMNFKNYVRVLPVIKHNTDVGVNNGSVSLKLKYGIASSYTWNPSGIVSNSITSLSNGVYSVTASDSLNNKSDYKFDIGYKVQWTNLDRCKFSNDSLVCIGPASSAVYASASSKNTLEANTDGWFEYVMDHAGGYYYYIGFTDSLGPKIDGPTDIDYGIWFWGQTSYMYYYENGTTGNLHLVPSIGDIIRVERVGNTIYYKINGVIIRTVTNSTIGSKVLKLKANLSYPGNRLINVGCSFNKKDNINFENFVQAITRIDHASSVETNNGGVKLTPRYGGTYTYSWQPTGAITSSVNALGYGNYSVTLTDDLNNKSKFNYNIAYKTMWQNLNNTVSSNDTLRLVTYNTLISNSACSKNILQPNVDGWFELVISNVGGGSFWMGFADSTASNASIVTDIQYGIYFWDQVKYYYYYESGANSNLNLTPRVGDILRIERIGNTINYKVNGVLVRTITNANIGPKKFKIKANLSAAAKIINLGCSFTPCTYTVSAGSSQSITCTSPTLTLTASTDAPAGSTYSWSPGGSTPTNSTTAVSSAGIYTLMVTNPANGCQVTSTVAVLSNLSAGANITNYINDTTKGQVDLCIMGGTPPYNIAWNGIKLPTPTVAYQNLVDSLPGITVDSVLFKSYVDSLRQRTTFSGLEPGTYSVTVYDNANDSTKLIAIVSGKITWYNNNSGIITQGSESKTVNGNTYFYNGGQQITQTGIITPGNSFALINEPIFKNQNNLIEFEVLNEADTIFASLSGFSQEVDNSLENLKRFVCLEFKGNSRIHIWFNGVDSHNEEFNLGDVFGISNDTLNGKINFFKNKTLMLQRDIQSLENENGFMFNVVFGNSNARISNLRRVTPLPIQDRVTANVIDISCGAECSGSIDAYGKTALMSGPDKYELYYQAPPYTSSYVLSNTINTFPSSNHALFTSLCAGKYIIKYYFNELSHFQLGDTPPSSIPGMISANFEIGYKTEWQNIQQCAVLSPDNTLKRNFGTIPDDNAGASSINLLKQSSNPEWIEFKVPQTGIGIGLSTVDLNTNSNSINCGLFIWNMFGVRLYGIIKNGVLAPLNILPAGLSVSSNDVFRFEKTGNILIVKVNNSNRYSTTLTSGDYILDASIRNLNTSVGKPRMSFGCSVPNQYAILKSEMDAGYYQLPLGQLQFTIDGEYSTGKLKYKILNNKQNVVISNDLNAPLSNNTMLKLGDNRYQINCFTLPSGYYTMEVSNEKDEKLYLRFKR